MRPGGRAPDGRSRSCPRCAAVVTSPGDFDPSRHPLIARAHHRNPGIRIGRTDSFFESLASAIIEQKVTGMQAFGAWKRIVTAHGERAPGPTPRPMFAPPSIDGWQPHPVVVVASRGSRAAAVADHRRGRAARRGDRTRLHDRGRRRSTRSRADQPARNRAVDVGGDAHPRARRPRRGERRRLPPRARGRLRAHRHARRRRRDAGTARPVGRAASAGDPADRGERHPRAPPGSAPAPRKTTATAEMRPWCAIRGRMGA